MSTLTNLMYNNFEMYFPFLAKHVAEYKDIGFYELLLIMDDGNEVVYDDMNHSFRYLQTSFRDMSKEQYEREFGYRLKRLMRIKGVTEKQLAEMTGLTTVCISRYAVGRSAPSLYNAKKIAIALGCRIQDLLIE